MGAITLSPDNRNRLQSFLVTRFDELKRQRDRYDLRVKDMVADYNSIPGKKKDEWSHNHFIPYTYSIIKTVYPRLYFSIFGNQRWLYAQPEMSDEVGKANQMSTWMQRVTDLVGFKKEMRMAIKRAMIYPNVVLKKTIDQKHQLPRWDIVDYFDYWQDISFTTTKNAPDCFHRIVRSKTWMKNKYSTGHYFKDTQEKVMSLSMNGDIASLQATCINYFMANGDDVAFPKNIDSTTNSPLFNNVELMEWHGKFDVTGNGEMTDVVATMADRSVLVRIIDAPFDDGKPFTALSVDNEPVGFYNKTYTSNLAPLQYMLNDIVNKRFDNFALILNKMFKVRRNSVVDYETLFSAPGNVIELDDLNDIAEFQFGNIVAESYQQESAIRQDMQLISGMIDYASTPEILKGVGNTATGLSILTSEAISKYREPLDNVKEGIEFMLADMFATAKKNTKNISFRQVRAYDSHDVWNISDEDFRRGYSFSIQIKNFMPNKQQTLQELVTLMNVIGQTPGFNAPAYLKNIFDLMDEIKNPNEIFPGMQNQIDSHIKALRELQAKGHDVGKTLNDLQAQASSGQDMATATPEERLINGVSLGAPLNPTHETSDSTNMTTIQQLLAG